MKSNKRLRRLALSGLTAVLAAVLILALGGSARAQGGDGLFSDGAGLGMATDLFNQYDADGNGLLGEDEFATFLSDQGIVDRGQFNAFDLNGGGTLNQNEFTPYASGLIITGRLSQPGDNVSQLGANMMGLFDQYFGPYDINGNGMLDESEFNAFLADHGIADRGQFNTFDLNGDGALGVDEFTPYLQGLTTSGRLGQLDSNANQLGSGIAGLFDQYVGQYDSNGNGMLDDSEFSTFLNDYGIADRGQFDTFDLNGDGALGANEFTPYLQGLTTSGRLDQLDSNAGQTGNGVFGQYDTDTSGVLDANEFGAFLEDQGIIDRGQLTAFDGDGDGTLSQNEFTPYEDGLTATGRLNQLGNNRNQIGGDVFSQYDANGNRLLDADEFSAFLQDYGIADRGQLDMFDLNRGGALDQDEFMPYLNGLMTTGRFGQSGNNVGRTGVSTASLFEQYDQDANALLDENEFATFLNDQDIVNRWQFAAFNEDFNAGLDQSEFDNYLQGLMDTGRMSIDTMGPFAPLGE